MRSFYGHLPINEKVLVGKVAVCLPFCVGKRPIDACRAQQGHIGWRFPHSVTPTRVPVTLRLDGDHPATGNDAMNICATWMTSVSKDRGGVAGTPAARPVSIKAGPPPRPRRTQKIACCEINIRRRAA